VLAEELLARLGVGIGHEVECAEPPVLLGGGFFTANFRLSLKRRPAGWSCPMVVRLFPNHGSIRWTLGAAVQTFGHNRASRGDGIQSTIRWQDDSPRALGLSRRTALRAG
jgi:hypothetical protein